MKLICRNEEKLDSTLTEKQKEVFEKFKDCQSELSSIAEREAFVRGFTLGARIIIEVMSNSEDNSN